jgi:glutamate synthase (NADPH/NADH) large chain
MKAQGLYDPTNEHDACGVGFIAHIKGQKSHSIVEQGLKILHNLDHRGAVGADPLMGDGAGILIQVPDQFYREEMAKQGVALPPPGEYGVGMVFLPKENASRIACEQEIERAVHAEAQVVLGWRDVPVNREMPMSPTVRDKEPVIRQIFIGRGQDIMVTDALERKLYVIRKSSGHAIQALSLLHGKEFFVPSMSARTVVYKGLLLADQVGVGIEASLSGVAPHAAIEDIEAAEAMPGGSIESCDHVRRERSSVHLRSRGEQGALVRQANSTGHRAPVGDADGA